jgi:acyl carrier protein
MIELVAQCVRETVENAGIAVEHELCPETRLYGEDGILDSLALVSLVVSVEQSVEDQFGMSITLANRQTMSQARSPFRSVQTLSEYTLQLIVEKP